MGTFVIYARKSTESEDRQVLSIESQVREVRQIARHHGVVVGDVLTESRSAKAPGRPVFNELVRRIHRGEVTGILCWKMDRLARNPYDSGLILQAQADGQLERIITTDGVKTTNGNDRLMGTFELAFAAKYIDDLRQNVKRGLRARYEKGWPQSLPPIGYLNERTTKTIVPDPDRFDLVRRMWDALLSGQRPRQIARIASHDWGLLTVKRGRTGGNPITYSSTYNLFTNPYYAGFIRLKDGREYLGAHPPMITKEEFERAQVLLKGRGRAGPVRHDNPFAGLVRCGNCGCSVVVEYHTKRGTTYTYHRCGRVKRTIRCREKPITEDSLLSQLSRYCRLLVIPEPILDYLRRKLEGLDHDEAAVVLRARQQRERALAALKDEELKLVRMRMRGQVTDEMFDEERKALVSRRIDLEQALGSDPVALAEVAQRKAQVSRLLDLAHGVPHILTHRDPVQMRTVLQQLHLEILLQSRRLSISAPEPLSKLLISGANSSWCSTWPEIWNWISYGDNEPDTTAADGSVLPVGDSDQGARVA